MGRRFFSEFRGLGGVGGFGGEWDGGTEVTILSSWVRRSLGLVWRCWVGLSYCAVVLMFGERARWIVL